MNRLKYLALAALVGFAACGDGDDPVNPTSGTITGTVTVEGTAVSDATASLSSGETAMTDSSGTYSFTDLDAGDYTVSISDLPSDATFSTTSGMATISRANKMATVDFDGTFIRTSGILGAVEVSGAALEGATVSIGDGSSTTTDTSGEYAFSGLRAGDYTVSVSDFDGSLYTFPDNDQDVTVAVGESLTVNFEGEPASSIAGVVVNDRDSDYNTRDAGEAIAGVRVLLYPDLNESGTLDLDETAVDSTTTDATGAYVFDQLPQGSSWFVRAFSTEDVTVLRFLSSTGVVTNTIGPLTTSGAVGTGAQRNQNGTVQVGNVDPPAQGDELPRWNYAINAGAPDGGNLGGGSGPNALAGALTTRPTHFIPLYGTGTVRGTIVDENGDPAAGVTLNATLCNTAPTVPVTPIGTAGGCTTVHTAPSPWIFNTTTNANGEYMFEGLLEGVYEINISPATGGFSTLLGFDGVATNGDEVPLLSIIGNDDVTTVPDYEVR